MGNAVKTIRRYARPVKAAYRSAAQHLARRTASTSSGRRAFGTLYDRLPYAQKAAVFDLLCKIFGDYDDPHIKCTGCEPGEWAFHFAGRRIVAPINEQSAALDWALSLAILGCDIEIKQTYERLLSSADRPDLFIDVGANYGTHSILFLACGIKTISVEPNSTCHPYFNRLCAANGVIPIIDPVAIGNSGATDLFFPNGATWLGSVEPSVVMEIKGGKSAGVEQLRVEQRPLSYYSNDLSNSRFPLIKIDTEGSEATILASGADTIRTFAPIIIFECFQRHRLGVFAALTDINYRIARLGGPSLSKDDFLLASGSNFIALPPGYAA